MSEGRRQRLTRSDRSVREIESAVESAVDERRRTDPERRMRGGGTGVESKLRRMTWSDSRVRG